MSSEASAASVSLLVSSSGVDEGVEWRELSRFPGYRVYEDGRVRGKKGGFLKFMVSSGYNALSIPEREKVTWTTIRVHILVALAFVENIDPLKQVVVDHIDGDCFNNHRTNLQWLSVSDNSSKNDLSVNHNSAVRSYNCDDEFLKEYTSLEAASRDTGVSSDMVGKCASGACKISRNKDGDIYKWKYVVERVKLTMEPDGIMIKNLSKYLIMSDGRVYSKFLKSFMKEPKLTKDGYCRINLTNDDGRKANYLIHRLVMEAYVGPSELQVNHKDSVRNNNDLSNLEYVTSAQNNKHAVDSGAKGKSRKGVCKIDLKTLEVIETYVSVAVAAKAHGVASGSIGNVCRKVYGKKTIAGFGWEFADTLA